MAKPLDTTRIVAEILSGQHDQRGDEIFQAILRRASAVKARIRWRIVYDDLTVTEDDLTLDECMMVEKMAGVPWHSLDPVDSAAEAAAVLSVALSRRRGVDIEDAVKKIGELGYAAVREMVGKYIVDASPLDQQAEVAGNPLS